MLVGSCIECTELPGYLSKTLPVSVLHGACSKLHSLFPNVRITPCNRLFMLYDDWHGVKTLLAKAKQLCDDGGDWERKNKLKVSLFCCTHTAVPLDHVHVCAPCTCSE